MGVKDPISSDLLRMAGDRLGAHLRTCPAHWKDMWPGLKSNIWERNAREYGLAITWGLTHMDFLTVPGRPGEIEKQELSRVTAAARAASEKTSQESSLHLDFLSSVQGVAYRGVARSDASRAAAFEAWRCAREI